MDLVGKTAGSIEIGLGIIGGESADRLVFFIGEHAGKTGVGTSVSLARASDAAEDVNRGRDAELALGGTDAVAQGLGFTHLAADAFVLDFGAVRHPKTRLINDLFEAGSVGRESGGVDKIVIRREKVKRAVGLVDHSENVALGSADEVELRVT